MNEKLSIITVCYNSVKTIERTILSVINQSNQNYEYIIIDGNSDDGTLDIIRKYKKDIHYFVSEPDKGIYDAMNKGIQAASGGVIAFLNSDDWYYEYTVEIVLSEFESGYYNIVCGDIIVNLEDNVPIYRKSQIGEDIYYKMMVSHQAVFAKSDLFSRIGMFDLRYKVKADYDWLLRAYISGAVIKCINKPLAFYSDGGYSTQAGMVGMNEHKNISIKLLPEDKKKDYLPKILEYYKKNKQKYVAYEEVKGLIENNIQLLKKVLGKYVKQNEDIYIWGNGLRGRQCMNWLQAIDANIKAVIDIDHTKWGNKINNIEIKSMEILQEKQYKVIITPKEYEIEIGKELEKLGYREQLDYVFFSEMLEYVFSQIG